MMKYSCYTNRILFAEKVCILYV